MTYRTIVRSATLALATLLPGGLAAQERMQITGLERPVEILKDRWGISHIYTQTERDLFFAQGYNA